MGRESGQPEGSLVGDKAVDFGSFVLAAHGKPLRACENEGVAAARVISSAEGPLPGILGEGGRIGIDEAGGVEMLPSLSDMLVPGVPISEMGGGGEVGQMGEAQITAAIGGGGELENFSKDRSGVLDLVFGDIDHAEIDQDDNVFIEADATHDVVSFLIGLEGGIELIFLAIHLPEIIEAVGNLTEIAEVFKDLAGMLEHLSAGSRVAEDGIESTEGHFNPGNLEVVLEAGHDLKRFSVGLFGLIVASGPVVEIGEGGEGPGSPLRVLESLVEVEDFVDDLHPIRDFAAVIGNHGTL